MAKITFINKTDKTQVFQKHSYGFMTIKPGETVDLYLDYTKDITTKAFIKSFYSPYESIFDITYSFDAYVSKPYLEFSSDGDFTLSAPKKSGKPYWNGVIEYSIDEGVTWTEWDGSKLSGTSTQPIYLRGIGNSVINGTDSYNWNFTGKYCTGNIENLLDYQMVANGEHPVMGEKCYENLFRNCTNLIQAPELPATTLANECYSMMFKRCTSLTTAPELPATTLVSYCYYSMFSGCTSLTKAPELPATTLAAYCYYSMFSGCTSLIQAPELLATTLRGNCYSNMFGGCTSLTQAPELSATELAEFCYDGMFKGCTSLTQAPVLPANSVKNSGRCYGFMFQNCTSLTILPKLSHITGNLSVGCFNSMFSGCTSVKISETQTEECPYEYRIPSVNTSDQSLDNMFASTGGTFTGTPTINTTYYTNHEPV